MKSIEMRNRIWDLIDPRIDHGLMCLVSYHIHTRIFAFDTRLMINPKSRYKTTCLPLTSNSGISIIVNESSNQVISLIGLHKIQGIFQALSPVPLFLSFLSSIPGLFLKNVEISSICKGRSLYRSARSNPRVGCVRPQDAVYCWNLAHPRPEAAGCEILLVLLACSAPLFRFT